MNIFKYRILNHILFWVFIFSFYSIPSLALKGFALESFVNIIYIPVDMVAVYIVIEFLIPQFIFRKRKLILFVFLTAVVISLNILVSQYILVYVQPRLGFWVRRTTPISEIFMFLVNNLMIFGTASALKLFSYSHKFQLLKSELEKRSIRSELGALRSQVNPHFLFNVLNNIDALIYEDKDKASNAIFLLSKIMRYMLKESNQEKAMLKSELEYIQDYIELAKLSFEDPDFLKFSSTGDLSGKQFPPLLFIPIIENTIKHCNKQSQSPGILIDFTVEQDYIELKTSNYIKRNDFKLPDSGSGSGMKNVEKRLKLLFDNNYKFEIKSNMDKFEVYLKVPLL